MMKVKFHGVRGSRPTHKRDLLGFGGNSTCLEIVMDDADFYLFIDGGTGLVPRGRELGVKPKINNFHFLITHTHWDHIIGFPFFEPLYDASNKVTFYSSTTSKSNFNDLFWGLHRADNLPVPVSKLKAQIEFKEIKPGQSFSIGSKVEVRTTQLNHQGITLGYRIQSGEESFAIVTDNAPIDNGNYMGENMPDKSAGIDLDFEQKFNKGLIEFLRGCHSVAYDTHFNEENLKPDWGHSSPKLAYTICQQAQIKRLFIFHHAPEDSDSAVYKKLDDLKNYQKTGDMQILAAREGETWQLKAA